MSIQKPINYIRIATIQGENTGKAINQQMSVAREYLNRKGLPEPHIVFDLGISGNVPFEQRQGGQEVLSLLEEQDGGLVIVSEISRLARDVAITINTVKAIKALGGELIYLDQEGLRFPDNS